MVVLVGVDSDRGSGMGTEQTNLLGMPAHRLWLAGAADMPVDADYPVGRAQHQMKVVGDDQHAAAAPVAQPGDQLMHRQLAREIHLLDRFVQHKQVGIAQQGAG